MMCTLPDVLNLSMLSHNPAALRWWADLPVLAAVHL